MLSSGPPAPIEAVAPGGIPGTITVTFDEMLFDGAKDAANWSGRFNDQLITVSTVDVVAGVVEVVATPGTADVGPDVISFAPPPFDLTGTESGTLAPAFTDFPIT